MTHLVYKKYEIQPTNYAPTTFLIIVLPSLSSSFLVPHYTSAARAYALGFITYYAAILTSIACYRLSPWHPLARYPGPILARLSKLWGVYGVLRGNTKEVMREVHAKYGSYVRIGLWVFSDHRRNSEKLMFIILRLRRVGPNEV